jgi:replication-associated recombination protein RarA
LDNTNWRHTENQVLKLFLPCFPLSGIYFKRFYKKNLESLLERHEKTAICLQNIVLSETEALLRLSGGDGRKLLNIFELVVNASNEDEILITNDLVFPSTTKYCFWP